MVAAIQLLNQAVTEEPSNRSVYRWEDLLAAIEAVAVGDSLGWDAERVLLRVVRFEGELRLNEDSESPHSMSPEEMLKSVAIQALVRWTGLTHLLEMRRVEATAASPVLASIVRATIRGATPPVLPASKFEVISEIRPVPPYKVVIGALGQNIGRRPEKKLPRSIVNKAVIYEHGLTFFPSRRRRIKRAEEELAFA